MDFAGITPLKNLFGELFLWYESDVHYNFMDKTIVFPSEKTKQKMRACGVDYREVQRDLYLEWSTKQYVHSAFEINKQNGYYTYPGYDNGEYTSIPSFGNNKYGNAIW